MNKNVAIIGAGACGLMLSTILTKNGIKHTIFNTGKIGNKILASGNGRCNISNYNVTSDKYHNKNISKIVEAYKKELFSLFTDLKIYTKIDDEGRMYPISESSLSVLNILLKNSNAKFVDLEVSDIKKENNKYLINDELFDYVVIAIGSPAGYKNKDSFKLLDNLNLKYKKFMPSLVGFKTNLKIKEISGARSKAIAYLYNDNKEVASETGEVIFKDDGISGICIMNLSSYYNHIDKKNPYILLDLADKDYDDYSSVLNPKLLNYINKNNIDPHKFIIPIKETYSLEFAQVANGGIIEEEINDNLSLKKYKNIFVGGEVIDVDGLCGGYNLMFAFTSAIKISKEILK